MDHLPFFEQLRTIQNNLSRTFGSEILTTPSKRKPRNKVMAKTTPIPVMKAVPVKPIKADKAKPQMTTKPLFMSERGPRGRTNEDYRNALIQANGNKRMAALALGVTVTNFYTKAKRYPEIAKLTSQKVYRKVSDREISAAIKKFQGNQTRAAKFLGISLSTMINRLRSDSALIPKGVTLRGRGRPPA